MLREVFFFLEENSQKEKKVSEKIIIFQKKTSISLFCDSIKSHSIAWESLNKNVQKFRIEKNLFLYQSTCTSVNFVIIVLVA